MKLAHGVLISALGIAGCGGSVDSNSGSGGGGSPSSGGSDAGLAGSGGVSGSCSGLDEATCKTRPGCRADHCPCPGVIGFVGCTSVDAPPTPCPFSCPLLPCADLQTLTDCQTRTGCHAVFSSGDCGCAACCCTFFDHCADGGSADCKGPATCEKPAPDCANPDCKGAYALSYANGCYEGCVLTADCAGP